MSHLTDDQFEDVMQTNIESPEHLHECEDCRNRLEKKQAIAFRLRKAFASVNMPEGLPERIHARRNLPLHSQVREKMKHDSRSWVIRLRWKTLSGLAAAAAFLIILIPVGMYFSSASKARAAQAELVKIHYHSLESHDGEFYSEDDPEKLADYFKKKLGFSPILPSLGHGLSIRHCCISHFRDEMVGSYVVDTPQGIISIIVVTDTPQSMGMKMTSDYRESNRFFWRTSYKKCNMVAVRVGNYSYCAVGEVSYELLANLLHRLLPLD